MPLTRFHGNHGTNLVLSEGGVVARRTCSFANAITFSERPLKVGEVFLVEIEGQERGWSGHLRCGLTQHNPVLMTNNVDDSSKPDQIKIPQYSMPDLANMGKTWIFAITKSHNRVPSANRENEDSSTLRPVHRKPFIEDFIGYIRCGSVNIPKHMLVGKDKSGGELVATCNGSRIGVTYEIVDGVAEMHFLINGEDQGAAIMDQADLDRPFYCVVDVYGTTKRVRVIQLAIVRMLQEYCRDIIRTFVPEEDVMRLPLPTKVKEYLKFQVL
ncbi:neuralized-like protein 2 [Saccoglossus kowalevskii]|uniref:Neuralized-like protein 2-like n=1 Tax=Saccoglossus kowalevskii TaxID=10224 RepID=A0ABM0GQT2_SACKO|nr:PREDICTED: neuralized-like protein 2-like [Saccoglossus kowalevskii]